MRKASLLAIVSVLIAAIFLAGCSGGAGANGGNGGNGGKAAENTGGKATTTTLTFWTFVELHLQFYQDAVKSWNANNPNDQIELKGTVYPYDDMHNKLLIALQSGVGAPDMVDIEISKFSNYLKGDKPSLEQLEYLIKDVRDKYVESRLNIYSKNGHLYGFPTHVGATVMYYNKEILDKAGVKADDIKTWDDYVNIGKKVLSATGKPMTTVEVTGTSNLQPMILQQDSDYFDKNGNVILDSAANIKALEFIKHMMDEKIAIQAPGGQHHAEEYYGFMGKGGAASVMMPMWYMGRFLQYMPDLKGKIIVRPMPSFAPGGKRSAGIGGTGTAVPSQGKNKEVAKKFLTYAKTSKEANLKIWSILGFDPPRWDVWADPAMNADNKYTDYFGKDIFKTLLTFKEEINSPNMTELYPVAADVLSKKVVFNVLKEQNQSAAEALKAAAQEVKSKK